MDKKLKRSSSDRVLAGVCGGIGEYFNTDPVVRVFGPNYFMPEVRDY